MGPDGYRKGGRVSFVYGYNLYLESNGPDRGLSSAVVFVLGP